MYEEFMWKKMGHLLLDVRPVCLMGGLATHWYPQIQVVWDVMSFGLLTVQCHP